MTDNEKIFKYVFSIILAICGWLITNSYNSLNGNVQKLNMDLIQVKMQLVELNSKIIDEQRVKEIVKDELLKHGIKE